MENNDATGKTPRTRHNGRPPLKAEAVRRITIGVRVNAAEFAMLSAKALRMGMGPTQWLRTAALNRQLPQQPVPEANRAAYAELSRLAVNLNQLARAANEGRAVVPMHHLYGLWKSVRELQSDLLGIKP